MTSRSHLCGFDLNFSYPETNGPFPALSYPTPSDPFSPFGVNKGGLLLDNMRQAFSYEALDALEKFEKRELSKRNIAREEKRQEWKRDLSGRANGTLDSWYACFLLTELYGEFSSPPESS